MQTLVFHMFLASFPCQEHPTIYSWQGPLSGAYHNVYTSEPLMHNSEPGKYAIIKRVCYSAVPRAKHCEEPILLTGAWAEHLEI